MNVFSLTLGRNKECTLEMFSFTNSADNVYPFKGQGRKIISLSSGSQPWLSMRLAGSNSEIPVPWPLLDPLSQTPWKGGTQGWGFF